MNLSKYARAGSALANAGLIFEAQTHPQGKSYVRDGNIKFTPSNNEVSEAKYAKLDEDERDAAFQKTRKVVPDLTSLGQQIIAKHGGNGEIKWVEVYNEDESGYGLFITIGNGDEYVINGNKEAGFVFQTEEMSKLGEQMLNDTDYADSEHSAKKIVEIITAMNKRNQT